MTTITSAGKSTENSSVFGALKNGGILDVCKQIKQ